MNWLKRNLFFVIGVAVAVALIGAAVFYVFKSMARNNAAFDHLQQLYQAMQQAASSKPSPGNDKINNTQAAHEQTQQLQQWIQKSKAYFQPIVPIPDSANGLSDAAFSMALHSNITVLQNEAANANVTLPPQYNFSFQAQSDKVRFSPPGSADKLAMQLGEVKAITEIIFGAHVNALEAIQRLRVSDDDTGGQPSDYIDGQPITTDLATLTPYQVTFDGFSDQIADVLTAFATSSSGYIVNTINVQPVGTLPPPSPPNRSGLQMILSEQMLRVTLSVEVIKLSPGR